VCNFVSGAMADIFCRPSVGFDDICTGGGCIIPRTEHRAITVHQLGALVAHVCRRCELEEWISTTPVDPQPLRAEAVTLYDLVHYVVRPFTQARRCSYVEMVASESQAPTWFVSHWWGEPVASFLRCIGHHAEVRGLATDAAYWVCAYANNQHQIQSEVSVNPEDTSFFRAIQLSVGVLLILDESATTFSRIWCCFEVSTALAVRTGSGSRLMLDICTMSSTSARLLTQGVVELDKGSWRRKAKREADFPLEVLRLGLHVKVQNASASVEADKVHILNSLAKVPPHELDKAPAVDHPTYTAVNRRIAAICALACWRGAVDRGVDIGIGADFSLASALRDDARCEAVDLSFAECNQFGDIELQVLAQALPACLKHLSLDCVATTLTDIESLSRRLGDLVDLSDVRLYFSRCQKLSTASVELLGARVGQLPVLNHLELWFKGCSQLTSADQLGEALMHLTKLSHLVLDLSGCRKLAGETISALCRGLAGPKQLRHLVLFFGGCSMLADVDALGASLGKLTSLSEFRLGASFCSELTSLDGLSSGLIGLQDLEVFRLDAERCPRLHDVGIVGTSLASLARLRRVTLVLDERVAVASTDALAACFRSLESLGELHLMLEAESGQPRSAQREFSSAEGFLQANLPTRSQRCNGD